MKIMRIGEREEPIKEIPVEIHYTSRFDEPFTSLEVKFKAEPGFALGEYLHLVNGDGIIWRGRVTRRAFETSDALRGDYSITARSEGFVLSQTEACPAVYEKPSFGDMAAFYLTPHGIEFESCSARCCGEFAVKSGMTEWEVLESFCINVLGTRPFADCSGKIHSGCSISENEVLFDDGILSVKLNQNGEAAVKTVHYKPDKISDYKFFVTDNSENAVCGSEKYENLSTLPLWQGESRLNQIIKSSLRRTETLTVITDKIPHGCHVGDRARVKNFNSAYRIEAVDYRLKNGKTECAFTLLPENIWQGEFI